MSVTETGPRARLADEHGYVTTEDGLRLYWERHGDGAPTIVLLPANPISHLRLWKAQLHYLARRFRVIAYDGRGSGLADVPDTTGPWLGTWRTIDCLTVLDATQTSSAVLVGICVNGVWPSVQIAAEHPERVLGIIGLAPGVPLLAEHNAWWDEAGERVSAETIRHDYRAFLEFFFTNMFPEPHSTKQVEDAVAYGLDAPVEALVMPGHSNVSTREEVEEVCRRVRCPVLVVQGDHDNCQSFATGVRLAELTQAQHVRVDGGGHLPNARQPVLVNTLIHEFAARFAPRADRRTWVPPPRRQRRALVVSSPIGLGHAWRDVAVARELRRLVPGLEVHWLAQPPVTTLLERCGEAIHPASAELASEAAGVDAQVGEHELHAFQMLRRLDEIFCANFMVFLDLVRAEPFDVWIGDEAWEVDYFLHENPELKTAPYVWMADFAGVVPLPDGGDREAFLAADWNAQMVEHLARTPWVRNRSIFIGDAEDLVPDELGPGLPSIRAWTGDHFEFAGYITGFEPDEIADREKLRAELGFAPDQKVCIVAAGGSAAGEHLLRRAVAAYPHAKRRIPELRMLVVAGPRLDPEALGSDGVETLGYVHELYRALAACDVAICHGGLSTTMELTAARRPFLYFPLKQHFEQNRHVAFRLDRHRAGRRMSYDDHGPEQIAAALEEELTRAIDYEPIPPGGATRAASLIAELL
jgi:pimeloyl-ACP methyl ester carboxylesterase/UDP:flavonoid glycosyltransferase YjiC (YdhE family)